MLESSHAWLGASTSSLAGKFLFNRWFTVSIVNFYILLSVLVSHKTLSTIVYFLFSLFFNKLILIYGFCLIKPLKFIKSIIGGKKS